MFKVDADLNIDGQKQIITREPGIYEVQLIKVEQGTKSTGKDKPVEITIDYTVKVLKVLQLHDKELDPNQIVGKTHTDQIKLDIQTKEDFEKKVKRIAHVFTKAGVDKADILKIALKGVDDKDKVEYANAITKTFDPAKHTTSFNYRVIGNVMGGTPFTQAPGYLGFATERGEEQKFSGQELKGNNQYYSAVNGAPMPSAENNLGGGGTAAPATGGAF